MGGPDEPGHDVQRHTPWVNGFDGRYYTFAPSIGVPKPTHVYRRAHIVRIACHSASVNGKSPVSVRAVRSRREASEGCVANHVSIAQDPESEPGFDWFLADP